MLTLALLMLSAAVPDVSKVYRIHAPERVKVKVGETAHAKIEVVPNAEAHVSPDAPISLTLHAGPTLKLEKEKLGRAEAKETASKGVEFDIPVTATAHPKDNEVVAGTLTFFICTEKLCERQKREVAVAVDVE
jgi:hypothetical protein